MASELTQIESSNNFVLDENCTLAEPPDQKDMENDSNINKVLMTKDMIKQEQGSLDDLKDTDENHKICKKIKADDEERKINCDEHFLTTLQQSLDMLDQKKSEPKEDLSNELNKRQVVKTQHTGFSRQELLQDHVSIAVELDGKATYTCKLCPDKVFTRQLSIRNHMINIHENPTCHVCQKTFLQRDALMVHLKVHSDEQKNKCDICKASSTHSTSPASHKCIHTADKSNVCSVCSKAFREAGQLTAHMKIHFERFLQCPKCDKKFSCNKTLRAHCRTHNEERPYACSLCGKMFRSNTDLKTHLRVHTTEKPYKCEICSYAFKQSSYLRRHMRTHTGERPYKCSYCDKGFSERKRLVTHTRMHTGERPFKCMYCDAAYARNDILQYHMRTHTGERPFECTDCGKRFKQRAALISHQKIHTDEKPYPCPHCHMNFRHSGTLATHMLIHTNELPFKCDLCEKGFRQRVNLKRHVDNVHGGVIDKDVIIDDNCTFTDSPEDKDIDEDSHINGVLRNEDIIKQEQESLVDLNNPDHTTHSFLNQPNLYDEEEKPNWLTCLLCDQRFLSTNELSVHALEHTKSEFKEDIL